jgi:excinuclease UvrABC ATPase subunit
MKDNNTTTMPDLTDSLPLCDVFKLFCETDVLRPALHNPFEINGKIYATDAHCMIKIDKSNCDFDIKSNDLKKPNCEAVIPEENMNVVLNIDSQIFEQYKTEDETEDIGEDIECEACAGEGEVDWEFERYTKSFECPVCDGTGYKAQKRSVKTGNKTFGIFRVKLNDTYFQMEKFYKLIQVQKAVGGDIVLIHQSKPTSANLFRIGICDVLLMPCPLYNERDCEGVLNIA